MKLCCSARGPENKGLLSVIASDLDALNSSYVGLKDKVGKWIPCVCERCRVADSPEFFEQQRLLKRKGDNKLMVECPASYADVSVLELLDGVKIEHPPWMGAPTHRVKTVRIFLASSEELKDDRDAFDLYFRQQNDRFRKEGLYLEIVRWENFLDAMAETRKQDEYNEKVRACDIFVSLFMTKTGKFTKEEFDVAHQSFKDKGKPLIYTFFKNANISTKECKHGRSRVAAGPLRTSSEAEAFLYGVRQYTAPKTLSSGTNWTSYWSMENCKGPSDPL